MGNQSRYCAVHLHMWRDHEGRLQMTASHNDTCGRRAAFEWRGHDQLREDVWDQVLARVTEMVNTARAEVENPF